MNASSVVLLILCLIPGVSYGWGMRGTTIGGEKGAMLPGAIIGFLLSVFSGVLIVQENFPVFSALGAVAMYFGGSMSYGETLGLSMNSNPPENMKKGLFALLLKGFLWFGSFGCIFSTGVNAVSRFYSSNELALIFSVTPVVSILCYIIFNKPLKPQENRYPYFYFSKTRHESWGALLGIIAPLLVLAIIKRDFFSALFPIICGTFGGIGWVLGQLLQIYLIHHAGNSKNHLIRRLYDSRSFESWKAMECLLGAFGGLGAAIGFVVTYKSFSQNVYILEKNGGLFPYSDKTTDFLFIIWIILLLADTVHYFIKKPTEDKGFYKAYKIYKSSLQLTEVILYAALPFLLICMGSHKTANIMAFSIMLCVISQELAFETKLPKTYLYILRLILGLMVAPTLILQIIFDFEFKKNAILILYTAVYEVLTLMYLVPKTIEKKRQMAGFKTIAADRKSTFKFLIRKSRSVIIVHLYFILCISTVLIIIV